MRSLSHPVISTAIIIAVFLFAWQAYITLFGISALVLPSPWQVVSALASMLQKASTYNHAAVTLYEILAGFFIACATGGGLGLLLAKNPALERMLNPVLIAIQVTPKTPLIPLFILWFGFGVTSKVVIAAIFAFFPIFRNTLLGIKSIPEGYKDLMVISRASSWRRFIQMEVPYSLPYVFAGMEVAIVLAVIGAIVGEFLAGDQGLGYLTVAMLNAYAVPELFGVIVLLTAIGLFLHGIMSLLSRYLTSWHESSGD